MSLVTFIGGFVSLSQHVMGNGDMRYLIGLIIGVALAVAGFVGWQLFGPDRAQDPRTDIAGYEDGTVPGQRTASDQTRSEATQRRMDERESLRREAAKANSKEFTYQRYRTDLSGSSPQACLVFSSALDPERDYSPFLEFASDFKAAIAVDGEALCIGGLSFAEEQTLLLREGLPAADGRTLSFEEDVTLSFADRPAYVGFKGSGIILPRLDADGLPIETVNVDKVNVRVERVNDRALAFKRITQGESYDAGDYGSLWGEESAYDVGVEVWTGEMDIDSVANVPVTTAFPLEEVIGTLRPGAYFVSVEDAREMTNRSREPARAMRWIVLTDLALTTYRGGSGLDVTVRSLQTARQVDGVRLQLIAMNNEILAEVTTANSRAVHFDAPLVQGEGNLAPKLIVAYGPNGDFAVTDLMRAPIDLSSEDIDGRTPNVPVDGFLYTDRGIYRPGETIELTALLRDVAGRAVTDRTGRIVIYRPNGMEADRVIFTETELGAVQVSYPLPKTAARGRWRMVAEIDGGGTAGETRVSVEDFVAQRISVDIEANKTVPLLAGEARDIAVEARFLYGAPGAGLTVQSEARVERDPSPFDAWKDYRFGAHDASFSEEILELPTQTTDGAGKASVVLDLDGQGADEQAPLRLRTVVSVLEPGGRAVSESVFVPYRPRDAYLGVKPKFDGSPERGKDAVFDVVSLNAAGEAQDAELSWKLIEVNYNYDWYRSGGSWQWRRSRYVREVNTGVLRLKDGKAGTINAGKLDSWGDHRLVVTGPGGETETSVQFWMGWQGSGEEGVEAPDRVRLAGPKTAPVAGDRAEITILSPYDGEAQIVVATDRVLSVSYQAVSTKGTKVALPVSAEWGSGAYVMVSVYAPRDAIEQPKPRRAVGVLYVPADVSGRVFEVGFNVPDIVRPDGKRTIEVEVANAPTERMFLTLAAVDEGILQLTKFQTPDPVAHYFGKEALGVEIYDDYGRLLDPNLAAPGEIRFGGDQLGGAGLTVVPTRTVALFAGPVDVGRNGKASIELDIPEFNGELRLMAVAWSANSMGSGDEAVTVRDPVPVELSLPRFMAPGDTATATASIDNVELAASDFTGRIAGKGPVTVGTDTVSATVAKGERIDRPVELNATGEGITDLTLSVTGPDGLSVSRTYPIQTRSAFLPVTKVDRARIAAGATYSIPPSLSAGLIPGSVSAVASFSPIPIDAGTLYASLSRYPYGCTEQTVSRALPLLYAGQLAGLAENADADDTEAEARDARRIVQDAINTILSRQGPDGAIGLWREGDRNASPWLGAYTVDFLVRAKEQGYNVPKASIDAALSALGSIAQGEAWRVYGYETDVYQSRWHSDTEKKLMSRSAPYALYVLARAEQGDLSRMRYIHDRELRTLVSPLARAQLGAGLAMMGDRSRAVSAFEAAIDGLGYTNDGDYYQTPLRDLAGILALASEAGLTTEVAELAERLARDVPDPDRLSTQEKAFLLLATNALSDGKAEPSIAAEGAEATSPGRFLLADAQAINGASFTNSGDAPLFRTVLVTGKPASAPPAASSELRLDKELFGMTGGKVNPANLQQGDRVVVRLTVTPEQNRTNPVIVEDLLPAGFEIEAVLKPADGAARKDDDTESGAYSWLGVIDPAKVAEARDDRFVAAIDVRDTAQTLAYVVRAVTPGRFTLPGAYAEDMYRRDVFARTAAGETVIAGATAN